MNVQLTSDGVLVLSGMQHAELAALRAIPVLADPQGHPGALRRLYPPATTQPDAEQEVEADWSEHVKPDLEALFAEALETVGAAVEAAERTPPETAEAEPEADGAPEGGGRRIRQAEVKEPKPGSIREPRIRPPRRPLGAAARGLEIRPADFDAWYRALNQARLVMCERFGIDSEDPVRMQRLILEGRLEAILHYEFYTALCGLLVDCMRRRDGL